MKRTITCFIAGVGIGFLIGAATFVTFENQGKLHSGDSESTKRSTTNVPWLTQNLVADELIHGMIGKHFSDVRGILLERPDAAPVDVSIDIDSEVLNHGRMQVECEKLVAVKTANSQNLVVFGFDHADRCLGYWKMPWR